MAKKTKVTQKAKEVVTKKGKLRITGTEALAKAHKKKTPFKTLISSGKITIKKKLTKVRDSKNTESAIQGKGQKGSYKPKPTIGIFKHLKWGPPTRKKQEEKVKMSAAKAKADKNRTKNKLKISALTSPQKSIKIKKKRP
jgi:hypothetical protein